MLVCAKREMTCVQLSCVYTTIEMSVLTTKVTHLRHSRALQTSTRPKIHVARLIGSLVFDLDVPDHAHRLA